jgi:organic anion transporter 5A
MLVTSKKRLRMDGWMGGWVDEWMDGWMNVWMDGWMDGWVDGWMILNCEVDKTRVLVCISWHGKISLQT